MFVSAAIYLDALCLLLGDNSVRSRMLVKEFLEITEKDIKGREIVSTDNDLITVYKGLIKSVIHDDVSQENDNGKILLLKLKSNEIIKNHPVERDILTDLFTNREIITDTQIDQYLKRLRNCLLQGEIDVVSRKIFAKSRTISDIEDVDEQEIEILNVKEMLNTSLKLIESRQNQSDSKKSESYVSMSDTQSIQRSLEVYMDRNVRGVMKTGLQGLNKALGARGGLGLGETAVFAANSHNYKSGILVSFMIWAIVYNTVVVDPGRKAFVYFVSLENEVHQNLVQVFKALYGRIEKRHVDMTQISTDFIAKWMEQFFNQYNVELVIDRFTPHDFSYSKFEKRYNHFVDLGYQMILFDLDYMSEARGVDVGDTMSAMGERQLLKENYTKFANHAKQQGYLLVTGHQLNRKAEEVAGNNPRGAVKKFNPSMMADSSDVFRTIDILFFMHLENNMEGVKFLTMQNRKNRGNMDTPEKDKFCAYAFTEYGIEDDLGGPPKYVTDIDGWDLPPGGVSSERVVDEAMF